MRTKNWETDRHFSHWLMVLLLTLGLLVLLHVAVVAEAHRRVAGTGHAAQHFLRRRTVRSRPGFRRVGERQSRGVNDTVTSDQRNRHLHIQSFNQ